jgi:ribonuclease T1
MSRGRAWAAALAILVLVIAVALALASLAGGLPGAGPTAHATEAATAAPPVAGGPGGGGLPAISRADLPPEATSTLDRIAAGGPFPYAADGTTFENRERLLPLRPSGTYREYTVETPGSPDRGARRIVVAASGEAYWTPDHYATFFRIGP